MNEIYSYEAPDLDNSTKLLGISVKITETIEIEDLMSHILNEVRHMQETMSDEYLINLTIKVPRSVIESLENPSSIWVKVVNTLSRVVKATVLVY